MMMKSSQLYLLIVIFVCSYFLNGQEASIITSSIDTTTIRIGEQINISFQAKIKPNTTVQFTDLTNFGPFEVIESYPIDSIIDNNNILLTKKYGITHFDSGRYKLPRLPVVINDQIYFSDSYEIIINPVTVDTLKQKLYDIKPIIDVKSNIGYNWLWYLMIIPGALILFYLFRIYQPKEGIENSKEFKSPIEKATSQITRLEKKELWQKGDIKSYYSELTEIIRTYIEDAIRIPAKEKTSSEVILGLKKAFKEQETKISKETLSELDRVLKNADLVKFAKSKPLDFEITNDQEITQKVIQSIDKIAPENEEEIIELEEIQVKKDKNQTKRRLIIAAISTIFLIYIGLATIIYFKGFDGLSSIFGTKSTKEVLESEWYTSQYGSPGIKIETPEILERIQIDSTATNLTPQSFQLGNPGDDYSILISSIGNMPHKPNLNNYLETLLKSLEGQGAKDIIINEDSYNDEKGIIGKKVFGTLSVPYDQNHIRLKYEIMLLAKAKSYQQIIIMYKENDDYAEQIKQRIINSVEIEEESK